MRLPFIGVLIAGLLFLTSMSLFTVYETEKAIILRLGKLKTDSTKDPVVYAPGLHFKLPVLDVIKKIDTRIITLEVQSSRITTDEQKDVLVDFYVQYKIADVDLYYLRTLANTVRARNLLEQKVVAILKAEFGRRSIKEVVSGERIQLMEVIKNVANSRANKDLGISVIDVRVKKVDFPDEVIRTSMYPRMRAERERAASKIKSKGRSDAIVTRAEADKKKKLLLAESSKKAKVLRGQGDAEALRIYSSSYGKNIKFFELYRSLEAYTNSFSSKNDVLVIKPDGDFFKHFQISKQKEGAQ